MTWNDIPVTWRTHYPAANTAAVVTIAAGTSGRRLNLARAIWSYSATPTGGRLTVVQDNTTIVDLDITAAGPASLPLEPITVAQGTHVVITLAAGGAGTVGKLSVASVVT